MAIGIGGVMAEVAWIGTEDKYVKRDKLISNLCKRFSTDIDSANDSIEMAVLCGVISIENNTVILKCRGDYESI